MKLDSSYLRLSEFFYEKINPTPVSDPELLIWNQDLADQIALDSSMFNTDVLSGNSILPGTHPFAQAYGGHQFGHFNILGDGRAHLLTEIIDHRGNRWDLQLKGSGRTSFSRRGDGRAALGPMLREFLISESMHYLGVPTTRSLAVVKSKDVVFREKPRPSGVLSRIASSHIRVGTFQYAYSEGGVEKLRELADYSIQRHFPEIADSSDRYLQFLDKVIERQAELIAKWMNIGFIHGVMNTDNMTISGETIDYGPCAFMDEYHPGTYFSSIDQQGRYAYGNQPSIGQWNLSRFAETLIPFLSVDKQKALELAKNKIEGYSDLFSKYLVTGLRRKLGMQISKPEDLSLIEALLSWMLENQIDYTTCFRALTKARANRSASFQTPEFIDWEQKWLQRLNSETRELNQIFAEMNQVNPVIIPRNHLVEEALSAAVDQADMQPFNRLLQEIRSPYIETDENLNYRLPKIGFSQSYKTFCGT